MLQFPKVQTLVDFLLLKLVGCDFFLGIHWLCLVSPMQWNFVEHAMRFTYQGIPECLKGINDDKCVVVSASEMLKEMKSINQLEVI